MLSSSIYYYSTCPIFCNRRLSKRNSETFHITFNFASVDERKHLSDFEFYRNGMLSSTSNIQGNICTTFIYNICRVSKTILSHLKTLNQISEIVKLYIFATYDKPRNFLYLFLDQTVPVTYRRAVAQNTTPLYYNGYFIAKMGSVLIKYK